MQQRESLFLGRKYLSFFMGLISIALALGWGKYVGRVVYLPELDYIDVFLGILVGAYLIWIWVSSSR